MKYRPMHHVYNNYFNRISYKARTVEVPTTPLFIARIWDCYGEEIDYTTHRDPTMLENIVRGDWEGSNHATSFTIFDSEGNELLHDEIR